MKIINLSHKLALGEQGYRLTNGTQVVREVAWQFGSTGQVWSLEKGEVSKPRSRTHGTGNQEKMNRTYEQTDRTGKVEIKGKSQET